VLLLVVALLVIAGIAAFVIADRKFAILKSPPFSYSPFVTRDTRLQLAMWPERAAETVTALMEISLPENRRPSNWFVRRVLPQQTAVLMAPDMSAGIIGVTVFINEQRLGPVIRDNINSANISTSVPAVHWAAEGMVLEKRGVLTLHGETPIDPLTMQLTQETWSKDEVTEALPLEGSHAAEMVLDNRDGGAFAILSALGLLQGDNGKNDPAFFVGMFANVSSIRIFADFPATHDAEIIIRVECRPEVEEDIPGSLQFFLDMGISQAKKELQAKGVAVTGASRIEGKTIVGEYTISGLDKLVPQNAQPAAS
jgi:hypothetical protein